MTLENSITGHKQQLIETLRERMKDSMSPEMYNDSSLFYRFLKARDFNLDNAEKMLRKHLEWRKAKGVDTIVTNYKKLEVFQKYLPDSRVAFDKEGSACRFTPAGGVDIKGLNSSATIPDLEMAFIQDLETDLVDMKERNRKFGTKEARFSYIIDFGAATFATVTDKIGINACIQLLKSYQDNYPERLKAIYIINASIYFSIGYAVVKNFAANSILGKVHIFGQDGWKEEFCKIFDPNDLPAFLGGNKTDPDGNPLCKTFICHGGAVPVKYYVNKNKKTLVNAPGSRKITLSRASFYEMRLKVAEPQSLIEWEFETKNRDIGFGVFHERIMDGLEKLTELVPIQRIDTEAYAEKGMYRCGQSGTYILVFDNTYSWIRGKEIYYRVSVVSPKQHEAELEK